MSLGLPLGNLQEKGRPLCRAVTLSARFPTFLLTFFPFASILIFPNPLKKPTIFPIKGIPSLIFGSLYFDTEAATEGTAFISFPLSTSSFIIFPCILLLLRSPSVVAASLGAFLSFFPNPKKAERRRLVNLYINC